MVNEQKLKELFLDGDDRVITMEKLEDKYMEVKKFLYDLRVCHKGSKNKT